MAPYILWWFYAAGIAAWFEEGPMPESKWEFAAFILIGVLWPLLVLPVALVRWKQIGLVASWRME